MRYDTIQPQQQQQQQQQQQWTLVGCHIQKKIAPVLPRDRDVRARPVVRHYGLNLLAGGVLSLGANPRRLVAAEAGVVGDDHAGRAQVLRPPHLISISIY